MSTRPLIASPSIRRMAPGIALCAGVALLASGLRVAQASWFGQAYLEELALAILLGMAVRGIWKPGARWVGGIQFTAKTVLELAIVFLGAALNLPVLLATAFPLALGTMLLVGVAIGTGYAIGRLCGLGSNLALLVASGNAICGNSAIAAIAPVIDAEEKEVASAVTFTAVLGIAVVVLLPALYSLSGLSERQYGILAGLSVYAVPQVLAAAYPVSPISGQIGTLVKLVRVLMLGPVVMLCGRFASSRHAGVQHRSAGWFPWFIIGFALMGVGRSAGWITPEQAEPLREASGWLTTGAMAALGLMADPRAVFKGSRRVATAAILSLLLLITAALAMIFGLCL